MKNRILAFSAAILLASGLAFAASQSTNRACCNVEASTCNGVPCPAPDQCPVPCCEDGSACK